MNQAQRDAKRNPIRDAKRAFEMKLRASMRVCAQECGCNLEEEGSPRDAEIFFFYDQRDNADALCSPRATAGYGTTDARGETRRIDRRADQADRTMRNAERRQMALAGA